MDLKQRLEEKRQEAVAHFRNEHFDKAIDVLLESWEMIPGVKYDWCESFHVSKYLALIYLKTENFERSLFWSKESLKSDPERQDYGEKEFLIGKVLFEFGHKDKSLEYFELAQLKSNGTIFRGEPPKYALYLNSNKKK